MSLEILIAESALRELKTLRVVDQRRIRDAIDSQLPYQPTVPTRNRKQLKTTSFDFEHVPPVWELRVGDYRVFYDVDVDQRQVHVRAVRRKLAGQTTEEIT